LICCLSCLDAQNDERWSFPPSWAFVHPAPGTQALVQGSACKTEPPCPPQANANCTIDRLHPQISHLLEFPVPVTHSSAQRPLAHEGAPRYLNLLCLIDVGLLTLALLQLVPPCPTPIPAIDASALVLPLPRTRRQCPTTGVTATTADTHPIRDASAITRTLNPFGLRRLAAGLAPRCWSVCSCGTPEWTVGVDRPHARPSSLRRDLRNVMDGLYEWLGHYPLCYLGNRQRGTAHTRASLMHAHAGAHIPGHSDADRSGIGGLPDLGTMGWPVEILVGEVGVSLAGARYTEAGLGCSDTGGTFAAGVNHPNLETCLTGTKKGGVTSQQRALSRPSESCKWHTSMADSKDTKTRSASDVQFSQNPNLNPFGGRHSNDPDPGRRDATQALP
jgi:hypothetical protein